MPHLILEVSKDIMDDHSNVLDLNALQKELHLTLASFETVDPSSIKTRVNACAYWSVGTDNDPHAFMHLTLSLLPGRAAELRAEMSGGLNAVLKAHCSKLTVGCAHSVSVEELDSVTYRSSSVPK